MLFLDHRLDGNQHLTKVTAELWKENGLYHFKESHEPNELIALRPTGRRPGPRLKGPGTRGFEKPPASQLEERVMERSPARIRSNQNVDMRKAFPEEYWVYWKEP